MRRISEQLFAISAMLYCCVRAVECIICELTYGKLFVIFVFPFGGLGLTVYKNSKYRLALIRVNFEIACRTDMLNALA